LRKKAPTSKSHGFERACRYNGASFRLFATAATMCIKCMPTEWLAAHESSMITAATTVQQTGLVDMQSQLTSTQRHLADDGQPTPPRSTHPVSTPGELL